MEAALINNLLYKSADRFHQQFVEVLFFVHGVQHEAFNCFEQSDRNITTFAHELLDARPRSREKIYSFLLTRMSDEQKFTVTAQLCQQVLLAVVENRFALNSTTMPVVRDTLLLLAGPDIKLSVHKRESKDASPDDGDGGAAHEVDPLAAAKGKLLTKLIKKTTLEKVLPILLSLKQLLELKQSSLLKQLMMVLKELMHDFQDEFLDILASDKRLAAELKYDMQQHEQAEKEQKIRAEETKKALLEVSRQRQVMVLMNGSSASALARTPSILKTPSLKASPSLSCSSTSVQPSNKENVV